MLFRALAACCLAGLGAAAPACEGGRCAADEADDVGLVQTQPHRVFALKDEREGGDSEAAVERWASEGGSKTLVANFENGVKGALVIKKAKQFVQWKTTGMKVPNTLIKEICGTTDDPTGIDFMYHIHDKWENSGTSATGSDCGADQTGGHWDPTAACGGASGNPVCAACGTKGVNYTCDKDTFEKSSVLQYRFLTPDALGEGGSTCEFGDLSGMYGNIPAKEYKTDTVITSSGTKRAKMTASYGSITTETAGDCTYGNLLMNYDKGSGFELASADKPLDQLAGKSIVFHCGNGYQNPGARIFCAKLQ